MPATIEDVVRTAGVSTATVSRALRGPPNVAPSTRARILRVDAELDYVITPHVSRLVSGRRVIGLLAPLVDQWFFSKLLTTIELELINLGCDAVRFNIDTAANLATRHLINQRHTHIGLITGVQAAMQYAIPEERALGYRRALNAANIAFRPELVQNGNFSFDGGAEAMKLLYSVYEPPTAVLAISDEMAVGALKTLRGMNLRIPQDVSVIGFDDHDMAHFVDLTTVRQPVSQYGILAAQLLVERLESEEALAPRKIVCTPELIVRATTGPAPAAR